MASTGEALPRAGGSASPRSKDNLMERLEQYGVTRTVCDRKHLPVRTAMTMHWECGEERDPDETSGQALQGGGGRGVVIVIVNVYGAFRTCRETVRCTEFGALLEVPG